MKRKVSSVRRCGSLRATAKELGISIGDNIKAMLDAHSVSFTGGTISLHDEEGIPLRGLGIGSTRLLDCRPSAEGGGNVQHDSD